MSTIETLSTAIFDRLAPAIRAGDDTLTPLLESAMREAGADEATTLLAKSSVFVPELRQEAIAKAVQQFSPFGSTRALKLLPPFAVPLAADLFTDVGDADAAPLDIAK